MSLFPRSDSSAAPPLAPFQQEAVEWILDLLALRGGALLADGVGLGKSWIAAAVARSWEAQGGSTEIVVPAPLVRQWREIAAEFGLASPIVSHDSLGARPASADGAARLVIIDEAHRFRNPRTKRYRALALRARNAPLLLVTATPICNSPDDLRALLALLVADDALADRGVPSLDEAFRRQSLERLRAVVDELTICRDRGALPDTLSFAQPARTSLTYRPAGAFEPQLAGCLQRLTFPLVQRSGVRLLRSFLWRRLESSVAALKSTLGRLRRFYARSLECALRGVAMNRASYRAAFGDRDDPVFQDLLFPELWGLDDPVSPVSAAALRGEIDALEAALRFLAGHFAEDPKLELVSSAIANFSGRRGLVSTQSRDTATAVWSSLRGALRCGLVTGTGCRRPDGARSTIEGVFALLQSGGLDVVVATDVGCEGLNIQDASFVVHADLPWNPTKLEQRLGRVSRIGQKSARVDEIILVAQRSPVVAAIERKVNERTRLVTQSRSRAGAFSSARLDRVSVARTGARCCVVDLVEHRQGREGRATRIIDLNGNASSLLEGRESLRDLCGRASTGRIGRLPEIGAAVDLHVQRTRSLELQPPRLAAASCQVRLLEAAEAGGELTRELVELLSRRYRAGMEILFADALARAVDSCSLSLLLRAARADLAARVPYDATVGGCIVTEGWLRSAARRGRRRGR